MTKNGSANAEVATAALDALAARAGLLGDIEGISYAAPTDPRWRRWLIGACEGLGGRRTLRRLYMEAREQSADPSSFVAACLGKLQISVALDPKALDLVPTSGPLVVVANHPFGLLDGLAVCHLVHRVRADVKFLGFDVLYRIPEIRPMTLPIAWPGCPGQKEINRESRKLAGNHLREGGALVVFPAGAVSVAPRIVGEAHDFSWKRFTAKLVQMGRASVLPVYVEGKNSVGFQLAGTVSVTLRLALLVYEAHRRRDSEIRLRVGLPIPYHELEAYTRPELMPALRAATYALAGRHSPDDRLRKIEERLFNGI